MVNIANVGYFENVASMHTQSTHSSFSLKQNLLDFQKRVLRKKKLNKWGN